MPTKKSTKTRSLQKPAWKKSKLKAWMPVLIIALVVGGIGVWKLFDTFAASPQQRVSKLEKSLVSAQKSEKSAKGSLADAEYKVGNYDVATVTKRLNAATTAHTKAQANTAAHKAKVKKLADQYNKNPTAALKKQLAAAREKLADAQKTEKAVLSKQQGLKSDSAKANTIAVAAQALATKRKAERTASAKTNQIFKDRDAAEVAFDKAREKRKTANTAYKSAKKAYNKKKSAANKKKITSTKKTLSKAEAAVKKATTKRDTTQKAVEKIRNKWPEWTAYDKARQPLVKARQAVTKANNVYAAAKKKTAGVKAELAKAKKDLKAANSQTGGGTPGSKGRHDCNGQFATFKSSAKACYSKSIAWKTTTSEKDCPTSSQSHYHVTTKCLQKAKRYAESNSGTGISWRTVCRDKLITRSQGGQSVEYSAIRYC